MARGYRFVSSSVWPFPSCTLCFAEALEMNDFPGPQEFDDIIDVRIVAETQNVVVGDTCFLLRSQIFCQVGDQVALDLHGGGGPGGAGGELRIDAGSMIHKVGVKAGSFDLLLAEIAGQLIDDGSHHLQVSQLLSTDIGQ